MPPSDSSPDPLSLLTLLTRARAFDAPAEAFAREGPPLVPPGERVGTSPCVSCGREAVGTYCTWCGERRPEARHYTIRGFAEEAFESLSDVDGRLLRSLRTLFNRPGELTVRYMRGERVRWVPPLRLFLLMNIVFFVLAHRFHIRVFDTPLHVQMTMQWYSKGITPIVHAHLAGTGLTMTQYAREFDGRTTTLARSLVIVMVPVFALVAALVNARQRRPALHHLTFALHTYAALLGLLVGTWAAIYLGVVGYWLVTGRELVLRDGPFSLIQAVAVLAFVAVAQRVAYGDSRGVAIAKATILVLAMGLIVQAYRPGLFFVTLWSS
ncbi:MAG TPA: DUF3667 domain-containing protein [Gemmatimonadaceae bacterium]